VDMNGGFYGCRICDDGESEESEKWSGESEKFQHKLFLMSIKISVFLFYQKAQ
jgi:hypothetical protein